MNEIVQGYNLFTYNPQLAQTTLEILNADFLTVFAFLVAEILMFCQGFSINRSGGFVSQAICALCDTLWQITLGT